MPDTHEITGSKELIFFVSKPKIMTPMKQSYVQSEQMIIYNWQLYHKYIHDRFADIKS